jgi:hypothetical protein
MRLVLPLGLLFAANIAVGCSTHETVTNDVTYDASDAASNERRQPAKAEPNMRVR